MKKIIRSVIIIFILLMTILLGLALFYIRETGLLSRHFSLNKSDVETEVAEKNQSIIGSSLYPIIFVHGWMGKSMDYLEYESKLEKEGIALAKGLIDRYSDESICPEKWPPAISVSIEYYYENNSNRGIEEYAKELAHSIDLVRNCTGSEQVIIIAHSMGGLVSRKYMIDYGNQNVKKLITLATPHYGFNEFTRTEIILMIIRLFTNREKEVEQMRPGSDFLRELDAADANKRENIVSIGTYDVNNQTLSFGLSVFQSEISGFHNQYFKDSDVVVKLDSTKLAGAKHYAVEGCSHTELLDFRRVYPKGPISNPKTCPEAYEIVKKEILTSK